MAGKPLAAGVWNAMDQSFEPPAAQAVGHLGGRVLVSEEGLDVRPQVAVAEAVGQTANRSCHGELAALQTSSNPSTSACMIRSGTASLSGQEVPTTVSRYTCRWRDICDMDEVSARLEEHTGSSPPCQRVTRAVLNVVPQTFYV